jgi:hypothetical protein
MVKINLHDNIRAQINKSYPSAVSENEKEDGSIIRGIDDIVTGVTGAAYREKNAKPIKAKRTKSKKGKK